MATRRVLHQLADGSTDAPVDNAVPLYIQLANRLKQAITDGTYPVGTNLPTESELIALYDVSRHTVREAVRVLQNSQLVSRRPGAGTAVINVPSSTQFTHEANSVSELLQYVAATRLIVAYAGHVPLTDQQAHDFGAQSGEKWLFSLGVRVEEGAALPFSISRRYIRPIFPGLEEKIRGLRESLLTVVERDYGVTIVRAEQEFKGVVLSEHDAENLGQKAGMPALQILRSYYDAQDRLIIFADNIHSGERFSYKMKLARSR
jgi:DNA-binding GntR family transcriptional regulator